MRTLTEEAARAPDQPGERRVRRVLFVFCAALFVVGSAGVISESDGRANYETTRALVEEQNLSIDPSVGVPGRNGASVSRYGLGIPILSLPFYVAARPFASLAGDARDKLLVAAVSMMLPLMCAVLVVAMYMLARRLGASRRSSLLASFGGVVGTFVVIYTKTFFGEPLVALAVVLAIERILAGREAHAGWALAFGIITRAQMVSILPVFAFVLWRRGGMRALVRATPGVATGIAVILLHNLWRFGSVTSFGYDDADGFTTPLLEGTWGLLTHPAKSIVLFAPVVVLLAPALTAAWRSARDAVIAAVGSGAITFVLAAMWWSWMGGWSWGPRLLIPVLVPLLPFLAPWLDVARSRARAAGALLLVGFLISVPAVIVSPRAQQLLPGEQVAPTIGVQYSLIGPAAARTGEVLEREVDDARRYLNFWQVNVTSVLGLPGLAGSAAGTLLLGAVVVAAGRRLRGLVDDPA